MVFYIFRISHISLAFLRNKGLKDGDRLAKTLTKLGPTFIKLGQVLSTRADIFGEEITSKLGVLQDNLPPFSSATALKIAAAELGDVFAEFDEKPAAAASIAQVHFARLKTGEEVAVKILRPKIAKKIARDIKLFYFLAKFAQKVKPRLKPVQIVETLENAIKFELDLRMEAASANKLANNFKGHTNFYVPKIYWQHTTQNVLVMEKVGGVKINDRAAIIAAGLDPDKILETASRVLFKQVFEDGFFHADLHPGNVFVDEKGRIIPIDFGIMGSVDLQSRIFIAQILAGFMSRDYDKVAKAHFDAGYVPRHKNPEAFALACRSVGEPVMDLPINQISLARLLGQMFKVAEDFEMEAQPHLLLLQKTMMMAEGIGRSLNPNVNMWQLAQPLVEEWVAKNFSPLAKIKELLCLLRDKLPQIIEEVLKKV